MNFYHIVPMGDGYNYLGKDNLGNHILIDKATGLDISLIFDNKEKAMNYIKTYLDIDKYEVQKFYLSDSYYRKLVTNIERT